MKEFLKTLAPEFVISLAILGGVAIFILTRKKA